MTSKARTLAGVVSTGAVLADGTIDAAEIGNLTLPTGGDIVGTTATQTLTNKTIDIASNTLTGVQASLVSGTNIKTVNSTSLLGSGDVDVQPTLVSGTNIKTINGGSVLGSGNLAITGGSWIKLSSSVAFGSSAVDFTGFVTSDYNTYAVVLYAFSVQSGSYAAFRFFVGGTVQTSGYSGSGFYSDASTALLARSGSANLIQLTNATNTNLAGLIFINANNFNSMTGTGIPSINSQLGGGTFNTNFYQSGGLNTTSPITGIRFYAEGGGTLAGYFDLYGIKR